MFVDTNMSPSAWLFKSHSFRHLFVLFPLNDLNCPPSARLLEPSFFHLSSNCRPQTVALCSIVQVVTLLLNYSSRPLLNCSSRFPLRLFILIFFTSIDYSSCSPFAQLFIIISTPLNHSSCSLSAWLFEVPPPRSMIWVLLLSFNHLIDFPSANYFPYASLFESSPLRRSFPST